MSPNFFPNHTKIIEKDDTDIVALDGISAAAGKLGSIVAVLIVYGINAGYKSITRQGLIFLLFATFMALGAVCSWAYLPDIQRVVVDGQGKKRLETKSLEELGGGWRANQQVRGLRRLYRRDRVP